MTVMLFLSMMLTSMIFIFLNHPLSLGFMLLIQTILVSLMTGLMNYNFWFSYIFMLIMVGGMLILFIYMTSIASNEIFKFSQNLLIFMILYILFLSFLFFINDNLLTNIMMEVSEMKKFIFTSNNNLNSFNKFYNWPSNIFLFIIIIYLLITLIMVVKITNMNYGPLRQKF